MGELGTYTLPLALGNQLSMQLGTPVKINFPHFTGRKARHLHPQSVDWFAVLAEPAAGAGVVQDAAGGGPKELLHIRLGTPGNRAGQARFSSRFRYTEAVFWAVRPDLPGLRGQY
jgi:hypothetical protein